MSLEVTVVGVGMVGDRILSILKERDFPMEWPPVVCATHEREEELAGETVLVEETDEDSFKDADVVFFAGREGAKGASVMWRESAESAGAISIDNGSDFRMDPAVPLVVPEVNMDAVSEADRFISSPNCSTIPMAMIISCLEAETEVERVVVSTYQSVSGWGVKANEELMNQLPYAMESEEDIPFDPTVLAQPIVFNYIPHIDSFKETGYTKEEMKMVHETQKILGNESVAISPTTVRVPVPIGHGESINLQMSDYIDADEARDLLSDFPGITVIDEPNPDNPRNDPLERTYPTARDLSKPQYRDQVLVGRVRNDPTVENGINLWCVSDNLRKGAALNVIQIAEALIDRGTLSP